VSLCSKGKFLSREINVALYGRRGGGEGVGFSFLRMDRETWLFLFHC